MATILDLPEIRACIHRWTVADYRKLTEDNPVFRRSELIRGIIVDRPLRSPKHSSLTACLYDWFQHTTNNGITVRQYGPLQLTDSVPEPDVAAVLGAVEDFHAWHLTTAELVVEVAVSGTAVERRYASIYAEAGVGEYWIVLGETEQVEVYRRPESGVYQEKRVYGRGEVIAGVRVTEDEMPVKTLFA